MDRYGTQKELQEIEGILWIKGKPTRFSTQGKWEKCLVYMKKLLGRCFYGGKYRVTDLGKAGAADDLPYTKWYQQK